MRKLVSYGLFFLMTWQIIGFVSYFEITHYFLKKEIKLLLKQGVPKEELVIFDFDKAQMNKLVWLKKNEFDLNGNLFDVVRRYEKKDGNTYMECISDKQETKLFFQLEHGIASNMGNDNHPTPLSNWFKILHFPVIEPSSIFLGLDAWSNTSNRKDFFKYTAKPSIEEIRIDSPPPRHS